MADSYQKERQLEASFFNNAQPATTSVDTLASLKALQHFYPAGSENYKAISAVVQEKARWTAAGIQALASSRMLQAPGGAIAGSQASAIAGQSIKQKIAASIYDKALTKVIGSPGVQDLQPTREGCCRMDV